MKKILLIVDPQNDFITGTLPVEGAEERMKKLSKYPKEFIEDILNFMGSLSNALRNIK